jgi:succinoglycan biosynthesis protein ExoL
MPADVMGGSGGNDPVSAAADADAPLRGRRIAYFAPEAADPKVVQRIRALQALGLGVTAFTYRRPRYSPERAPDWDNVNLGNLRLGSFLSRLPVMLAALPRVLGRAGSLRGAQEIIGRNLDNAVLALVARALAGSRATFVYEVLDIHQALLNPGRKGRLMRRIERWVLARAAMLVVSSPGYVRHYFAPTQGYIGPVYLLENKLYPEPALPPRPALSSASDRAAGRPWVIGWFGSLRCARTLLLLRRIAEALPDRVRIELRGVPAPLSPELLARAIDLPNMQYGGPYRNPDDLAAMFARVDFTWGDDFYPGSAFEWLLTNRLYESGYFNVPVLGVASHEVGRTIVERGWGWAFPEPCEDPIIDWLRSLSRDAYEAVRRRVAETPAAAFCDQGDLSGLFERLMQRPSREARVRS